MDTTIPPQMKPVLVQRVSDEIRDLRQSDVPLQQTLLTARAISDIFKGDTISKNNRFDESYFVGDLANLNLVIESGCRHLAAGSYFNGPKHAVKEEENGDQTPLSGFLYTLGMLPSGQLYWGSQSLPKTRDEIEIAISNASRDGTCFRGLPSDGHAPDQPPLGAPIRQLFFAHSDELDEPQAYTRIGRLEEYTLSTGDIGYTYRWGAWVSLNGETQYIVVTDSRMEEVINPIVNAVYSIHTNIPRFYLPDADQQKYGSTIRIIQHPDPNKDDRSLWATNVEYETIGVNEDDPSYEKMQITCTPAPRRNTVKVEEAFREGLVPTEYVFEVAPRMDDANGDPTLIGKTWHLKVDADETEFTTGIVELLDAHTELGIADIIDYANRKYAQDSGAYVSSSDRPLYINRAVLVDGYLKLKITKAAEVVEELNTEDWSLQIKRLDSRNPINFTLTKDVGPVEGKVYFIKKAYSAAEGVFSIATLPGGQFDCTIQYYEINSDADVQDLFTVTSKGLTTGLPVTYQHKIYRNDVVYVVINPGPNGHIDARGKIFPVLSFTPDPHPGSYVSREELNRTAFTNELFQMLVDAGQLPSNSDPADCPVSSQALLAGYNYLAQKLQAKGLLYGAIDAASIVPNPDVAFESGMYWISGIGNPSYYPDTATTEGARLIVFGNEYGPKGLLHENGQYFITSDQTPVNEKTYYIRDFVDQTMKPAGRIVDFDIGIKYYEKDPSLSIKTDADVTQLFIQTSGNVCIWMRTFKQSTQTWTDWACLTGGQICKSFIGNPEESRMSSKMELPADMLKSWMMNGDLTLFCGVGVYSATLSQMQQIHLPQPEDVPFGKKFTLAINGAPYSKVKVSYIATDEENTRAYIHTVIGNNDRSELAIVEIMSNGVYWFYKTGNSDKYLRIGG